MFHSYLARPSRFTTSVLMAAALVLTLTNMQGVIAAMAGV